MSFGHNMNKIKEQNQMYEDLKLIILDCQRLHLYTKEFYTVVRRIALLQIVVCSCSLITGCFIISLQLVTRSYDLRSLLQLISICVAAGVNQFMYSYFLDKINEKKDGVNFGLYSCDWTAMDIRFKKLLLLAMAMNNANQLKCKATPKKVVNLELFLSTLRVSYTIVSVMLNVQLKSLDDIN
ncbi:odorant receptor 2a-like [Adelges cooleyi]|uniref:odorant receptor 2a-like n=1 Tax=Adelges cooleyi TaxID=133065 RepID=UPI00217F8567|nr:odorant receptor 2a-like [Adelges cooleyi]